MSTSDLEPEMPPRGVPAALEAGALVAAPPLFTAATRSLSSALSPYLSRAEQTVERIVAPRGLSVASATLEDVFAADGLLREVIDGLQQDLFDIEVHRVFQSDPGPGSMPIEDAWAKKSGPGGRHRVAVRRDSDTGATEGYVEPDTSGAADYAYTCAPSLDAAIEAAKEYAAARLDRIPDDAFGKDYRSAIGGNFDDWAPVCATEEDMGDPDLATTFASYDCHSAEEGGAPAFGSSADVVFFSQAFVDIGRGVAGDIVGADALRASILVHELVHRADDHFGTCSDDLVIDGRTCPRVATEVRAAFVQGRFLGLSDCMALVWGNAYARLQCGDSLYRLITLAADELMLCHFGAFKLLVAPLVTTAMLLAGVVTATAAAALAALAAVVGPIIGLLALLTSAT